MSNQRGNDQQRITINAINEPNIAAMDSNIATSKPLTILRNTRIIAKSAVQATIVQQQQQLQPTMTTISTTNTTTIPINSSTIKMLSAKIPHKLTRVCTISLVPTSGSDKTLTIKKIQPITNAMQNISIVKKEPSLTIQPAVTNLQTPPIQIKQEIEPILTSSQQAPTTYVVTTISATTIANSSQKTTNIRLTGVPSLSALYGTNNNKFATIKSISRITPVSTKNINVQTCIEATNNNAVSTSDLKTSSASLPLASKITAIRDSNNINKQNITNITLPTSLAVLFRCGAGGSAGAVAGAGGNVPGEIKLGTSRSSTLPTINSTNRILINRTITADSNLLRKLSTDKYTTIVTQNNTLVTGINTSAANMFTFTNVRSTQNNSSDGPFISIAARTTTIAAVTATTTTMSNTNSSSNPIIFNKISVRDSTGAIKPLFTLDKVNNGKQTLIGQTISQNNGKTVIDLKTLQNKVISSTNNSLQKNKIILPSVAGIQRKLGPNISVVSSSSSSGTMNRNTISVSELNALRHSNTFQIIDSTGAIAGPLKAGTTYGIRRKSCSEKVTKQLVPVYQLDEL